MDYDDSSATSDESDESEVPFKKHLPIPVEVPVPAKTKSTTTTKVKKNNNSKVLQANHEIMKVLKKDPRYIELKSKGGYNQNDVFKLLYKIQLENPKLSSVQFTRGQLLAHLWKIILTEAVDPYFLNIPSSIATDDRRYDKDSVHSLNIHEHKPAATNEASQLKELAQKINLPSKVQIPVSELPLAEQGKLYLKKYAGVRSGMLSDEIKRQGDEMTYKRLERNLWYAQVNKSKPVLALPTLILNHHKRVKNEMKRRIDPTTYEVDYYEKIQKEKRLNVSKNGAMKSKTVRFHEKAFETATTHIPLTIPYESVERLTDRQKHPGKLTFFEGANPCFRQRRIVVGPDAYEMKSSIQSTLDKVTSLRGPYDVFSGPRDRILYGYNKTAKSNPAIGPGHYFVKETVRSRWNTPYNRFKGRFSKPLPLDLQSRTGERNVVVNSVYPTISYTKRPGPGYYFNSGLKDSEVKKNKFPFNSNTPARGPSQYKWTDMSELNPLRYDLTNSDQYLHGPKGNGAKSDFRSTSSQRTPLVDYQKLTERLRGKDIPLHERIRKLQEY